MVRTAKSFAQRLGTDDALTIFDEKLRLMPDLETYEDVCKAFVAGRSLDDALFEFNIRVSLVENK